MITRDAVDQPSFTRQISVSDTLPGPGVLGGEWGMQTSILRAEAAAT